MNKEIIIPPLPVGPVKKFTFESLIKHVKDAPGFTHTGTKRESN